MSWMKALIVATCTLFSLPLWAVEVTHHKGTANFKETPKRVVVLGVGALDIADSLGIQPVGAPIELLPDYLKTYEKTAKNTGSVKEPNLEAIYNLKPDVIIAETRMLAMYDQLNQIAPTVMLYPQEGKFWDDTQANWRLMGKLFNKEATVENTITNTEKQIAAINKAVKADNKNALMLMSNGGNIAMYNVDSRFSMVFEEFGFNEAVTDSKARISGPHGNLVSNEYIADAKPQVLFILDRDQAIGSNAGNARAKFDNALVNTTPAAKNDNIIYVDGNAWYVASHGITATQNIIKDVQKALK